MRVVITGLGQMGRSHALAHHRLGAQIAGLVNCISSAPAARIAARERIARNLIEIECNPGQASRPECCALRRAR
jgi:prephenate dehydrogenase